ncbi:MAG: hypothetical protein KAJ51_07530, partial [Thermoplasmata archaeon]|nr:hypothetical protein [Thermoplasmata archaeon]
MAFSTDNISWMNWEPFNTNRSWELTLGDAVKTLYYRTQDNTGNIADSISDSIILDTTPPRDLLIEINNNEQYTNTEQLQITLIATDSGSGVAEMSFSYDGVAWLPWEPFAPSKELYLPGTTTDGEKNVYYKVRDLVGNIANPVYDTIILDTTPPHSLSIRINNGAVESNSTVVSLDLSARDEISGVDQICFSLDGLNWSAWEDYSEKRTYNLPAGDGVKLVYFKVRDKLGNVAEPATSTIYLNITKPVSKTPDLKVESSDFLLWMAIIVIAIILIILILVSFFVMRSRKRRAAQAVPGGTFTLKPGGIAAPVISYGQVPSTLKNAQIPFADGQQSIVSTDQIPALAKSTMTAQQQYGFAGAQPTVATAAYSPSPAAAPPTPHAAPALPQLPPAQIPEQEPQPQISTDQTPTVISLTPTLAETPTETPQPTVVSQQPNIATQSVIPPTPTPTVNLPTSPTPKPQPTVVTPTLAEALASPPGPVVHLPETQQSSTSDESIENNNSQTKPR